MPRYKRRPGRAIRSEGEPCKHCREPTFKHDKFRVYPEDGPAGSYHYAYFCREEAL